MSAYYLYFQAVHKEISKIICSLLIRPFFLFLGLRILRPKFLHLKKKIYIYIFDFFYFLRYKKLPDLKKKKYLKKNNKNCMILHCKNAEMTILLSFLHFYSVK